MLISISAGGCRAVSLGSSTSSLFRLRNFHLEHSLNPVRKAFNVSPFLSQKLENYFGIYETLFNDLQGTNCTFMEIGILHGGSLFMWREFLGPKARIIGVDLNPSAVKWREYGFEIYIGSQTDPHFWKYLETKVESFDAILDDGGHTNEQQMSSVIYGAGLLKNGGVLAIEDTHSNFWSNFGNPSRFSFANFAHMISDDLTKFGCVRKDTRLSKLIAEVRVFPSITAFVIDRDKASEPARALSNHGIVDTAPDMRFYTSNHVIKSLIQIERSLLAGVKIGRRRKWLKIFNPLLSTRMFAWPRKLLATLAHSLLHINLRLKNYLNYRKLFKEYLQ